MIRRILGYGFLAVVCVGVISVAGTFRRPEGPRSVAHEPRPLSQVAACCAGSPCCASCTAGACSSATCTAANCTSGTCPGGHCTISACDSANCPATACAIEKGGDGVECCSAVEEEEESDALPRPIRYSTNVKNVDGTFCFNVVAGAPHASCGTLTIVEDDPIEQQLNLVRGVLARKEALSPAEKEIKGAIESYFLATKSEAAVQILLRIVTDAPDSPQAAKARAAISLLKGLDGSQPACASECTKETATDGDADSGE